MHVCEVAAACRGTYDVDLAKAPTLLSSSEDVAVFLHCAILLNHNSPLNVSDSDPRLRDILSRDLRLSHLLEPLLSQRIAESREGFDQAIHRRWSLYHSSSPLEHMASPNNRWVTTTTTAQDTQKPQTVHLNLLSGQILIDGKPLGRLPKEILTHPMYIRIFGQRIMEVVPSDLPGMEYKTSSPIGSDLANDDSGYHVFFTYQEPMWYDDQAQLVIRTKRDEEVLELIPHDTFKNDLPVVLINDHTHWLNISDKEGEIEIRSIQLCWKSSPHNWRIQFSPHGSSSMSREDNNSDKLELIDTRSRTMDMIATTLQPVENREYMVVTYSSSSDRLHVSLPRFRLEFFLNLKDGMEAQLESVNMPGMVIDSNQSSGTMLGLRSQLLLRLKDSPQPSLRQVIIPYVPDPRFLISPSRYHVIVTLDLGDQPTMRYFLYTVNSTLGRLDSDGTMLSKLYQIYLHAITSHCLPDPLTGCTGTEESLQGLRSAAMLSFQKLGEDECRMLKQISGLTPSRTYYPTHLKGMQTVTWSKHAICPLAQHSDFYVLTRSIWEYATTLSWLTEFRKDPQHVDSRETSDHLLQRAACRNALCYRHPVATSVLPSEQHDLLYQSRSRSTYTKEAEEVFNTSAMIFNWEARLASPCGDLFNALKHYGSISGPTKISLSYSREWLEPTIQDIFLSAINACRTASKANRYQMVFGLSACAYASVDARPFIPIIFAFAVIPGLRVRPLPDWQIYDLLLGPGLNEEKLSETVRTCTMLYNASSAGTKKAKLQVVTGSQEPEVRELVKILKEQWPCEKPVIPTSSYEWTFSIYQLQREAASLFQSCLQNKALFDYLQGVQEIINHVRQPTLVLPTVPYTPPPVTVRPYPVFNNISFQQLLITRPAPIIPLPPSTPQNSTQLQQEEKTQDTRQLRELLLEFRKSTCLSPRGTTPVAIQEQYANDLEASLQSLESEGEIPSCRSSSGPQIATVALYQQHQHQCEMHLQVAYHLIRDSLSPSTRPDKALLTAGLWPCLSRKSLLGALSFGSGVAPTVEWRKTLNSFARAVLVFQRSCRLTKYLHARKLEDFYSEIENRMMETENDDDDEQCSIRLLIQADSNFLARQLQIDFIKEMTCPSSKGNTVLQLNMGEGKSSVIVPIAAGVLSDGNKLVRVVVLRPLAPSMIQILVHRLGGLANRRVFYLPFCRTPRLTSEQAEQVQQIFLTCVRVRGVLVVQPDHILSFRLMGLDRMPDTTTRFASTESNTANRLLESQRWLFNNSRDILDESDEILHVKYQLVYTVGRQQSLHGSPDRWTIAQEILALVGKHARTINRFYPDGFEMIEDHAGGYPRIRILRDYAGKTLIDRVADDILNGALGHFSFDLFPPKIRSVVLSYLTSLEATLKDIRLVEDYCKSSDSWKTLLTLRGILAHGILQFVLKEKRWRVDYGPDPSRSLLAVPFRAKDVPCLRAEFSHPDVAILLTCLNYYWQGLSQSQLEQCFSLLLKQDSPALEYSKWILHSAVPEPLRHLGSINLRDLDQRLELYQIFHKSQAVINFFLSQVVFPRDAKEFPRKMATSGWDLAESKAHVTTGFSGTNDGRYLLPTSISQDDPLSQSSTNARVLMYLLHPENDSYHCLSQNGQQNSEQSLLRLVVKQRPEIRVLLDVGAQILELSNEEVVTQWLELNGNPDIHAAVFYGTNDEPYVRTRNGVTEEFVSSHFRQQMDKCLLYLDDAHTRGSDFKLPSGTRAAVTLGPKVTKDRLVQGCMRMRRLGRGHTVTFFAPPEVDHSIRVSAGLRYHYRVRTKDIVLWTMFESCFEVLHRIPQWAQQGMDHRKREVAWREFNQSPISSINQLVTAWLQNEARSLDEMYALDQADPMSSFSSRLEQCPDISSRYRDWAPSSSTDTHFQEEQEREIIFEVETERQVERPATAVAAHHRVESDVRLLIQRGQFAKSSAFVSIFPQLSQPSFEESSWSSPGLYCTKDFSITIQGSRYDNSSDYLRPVNWILSSVQADIGRIFVILSPFEVNELLPDIRLSTKVRLHQFVPRTTQEMKSCEDLDFNCIPPLISPWVIPSLDTTTRLNLLAGQLYLEDKRAYHHLCDFLGLYSWQPQRGDIIKSDGFIMPHHRDGTPVTISPFQTSPVPYLKQLFAARRKGMDYTSTHMGKILRGRLLTKEDFPAS
ncbi:hypothetical protein FRC02_010410 [Tulasnella sp. 418]|nr:hypothetical protein FRC02_010410 [Tulasnella sp. 418]